MRCSGDVRSPAARGCRRTIPVGPVSRSRDGSWGVGCMSASTTERAALLAVVSLLVACRLGGPSGDPTGGSLGVEEDAAATTAGKEAGDDGNDEPASAEPHEAMAPAGDAFT